VITTAQRERIIARLGYMPRARDAALLRTALATDDARCLEAWAEWRALEVAPESIDPASRRLLPAAYSRLSPALRDRPELGPRVAPELGRLQGLHRRAVYWYHLMSHRAAQVIDALVQDTGSGHEPSPHVLLDAAQVLANDEVDGSRLVELARALHQVTTIDAALRALESLGVALPRTARSAIARAPVSLTEAICHELRRGPRGGARAPLRILATYWFRRGRGRGAVRALAELPAYLRMRLVEP
jgi:hypothetical protein